VPDLERRADIDGRRQSGAWQTASTFARKNGPMIRPLTEADAAEAERLVDQVLGSRLQARLDEVIDVLALPGFGAWAGDSLVGLATYAVAQDSAEAEVAAVGVAQAHRGEGWAGRLLDAVAAEVARVGVTRLWLVTTNDNLTALGVYQRHGFRLAEIRPGAVDRTRALKPTIPEVAANGIPIHDELILDRRLA
jgi:ribosomal protein S18 acetylase RimI-like enzyme